MNIREKIRELANELAGDSGASYEGNLQEFYLLAQQGDAT